MLSFAVDFGRPIAIRFPRGTAYTGLQEYNEAVTFGKSEVIAKGRTVALIGVGSMVKHAATIRELLLEQGIEATVVNARFVKPIDEELLESLAKEHSLFVTMEENVEYGGYGQNVASYICNKQLSVKHLNISIKDMFVEHGKVYELYQRLGLDPESVQKQILAMLEE